MIPPSVLHTIFCFQRVALLPIYQKAKKWGLVVPGDVEGIAIDGDVLDEVFDEWADGGWSFV